MSGGATARSWVTIGGTPLDESVQWRRMPATVEGWPRQAAGTITRVET